MSPRSAFEETWLYRATAHILSQPDRDSGEGKGVFNGRTHLTIWVVWGGCWRCSG